MPSRLQPRRMFLLIFLTAGIVVAYSLSPFAPAHAAALELNGTSLLNDPNLVSYWRFEGNSNDATSSNNGSDTAITYSSGNGKFGQGAGFNGSTSAIVISDNAGLRLNTWTVSCWVKTSSIGSNPTGYEKLVYKGNASSDEPISLYLYNGKPVVEAYKTGSYDSAFLSGTAIDDGQWHHVVGVRNLGIDVELFVDGLLVGTSSDNGGTSSNTSNLTIGERTNGDSTLDGSIDDVAVFSRALSASEISDLYNGTLYLSSLNQYRSDATTTIADGGTTTENSVVLGATLHSANTSTVQLQVEVKPTGFPFAGTANVTSPSVSPGANATTSFSGSNGSYHWQARVVDANGSSSAWQAFGAVGTSTVDFVINHNPTNEASVHFDGSSGWAWPASTIALTDAGPFTIEFWYKAATSTVGTFMDTRSTTTGEGFVLSKNTNGINFVLSCDASSSIQFVGSKKESTHPRDESNWHHVAISKGSTASNPFSLYFDGMQQTTTNCFDASTTKPIWFGRSAVSSTDYFTGNVDEVRIWNIQRTLDQITGSSTQEISPTSTGLLAYWTFNTTSTDLSSGNSTSGQSGAPTFSSSTPLGAHFILSDTHSSVHNGMIRWSGSTQFSQAFNNAIDTWNAAGPIVIASTTGSSDLSVDDISTSTGVWTGVLAAWAPFDTPPDSLLFNSFYLASDTLAQVQNTATHELGHALGLDHSIFGNIMYYIQTSSTTLGSQDLSDYNYLWGN